MGGGLKGWPEYLRWRDAFHAALDPALYPAAWLDGEVACGRMLLFANADAAMLCSIKVYPSGLKQICSELATGKLGAITDLIPSIETWARLAGCRLADVSSREGWGKVLKRYGYEPYQLTLRKAL